MSETATERTVSGCGLLDLVRRFRPAGDHLAAAQREILLAAKAALEIQVEIIDEWRAKHARPEKIG